MGTMRTRTDAELIAAYGASRDETAFGEVVSRHGPMVYRVCLGLLRDPHEAEDCSQAVFVVLVRKARSLRNSDDLAAWLYGVAQHICLSAVRDRANRAKREEGAAMIRQASQDEVAASSSGLKGLVYQEMAALSSAQRQAVILRYLEGRSEKEAAEVAGCPQGTLGWRASKGLARLRERLAKRGQLLAVAPLLGLLDAEAKATIPATLLPSILATSKLAAAGAAAGATGGTVFALAEGAIKAMFWMKVKLAAVAMALVVSLGVVALLAEERQRPAATEHKDPAPTERSELSIVVRGSHAEDIFKQFRPKGLRMFVVGGWGHLVIPGELRFRLIDGKALAKAVADYSGLQLHWAADGNRGVLYKPADDKTVEGI
jgi:RNA polymerase sigma factor (sigma-70 family)